MELRGRRKKARIHGANDNPSINENASRQGSAYEEFRQQRIKANKDRLQQLGILDLSLNLKSHLAPAPKTSRNFKLPKSLPISTSLRRSSRLRSGNPVNNSIANLCTTIYDLEKRESCHQCRQKTPRLHTHCSSCKATQGQFCGSCLYLRYGENVIEVKENASWVCPVCRGICNCSRCRKAKGWEPTGYICKKASKMGFKSVAHYLIHTQEVTQPEDAAV